MKSGIQSRLIMNGAVVAVALGVGVMIGRTSGSDPAPGDGAVENSRTARVSARDRAGQAAAESRRKGSSRAGGETGAAFQGTADPEFAAIMQAAGKLERTQRLLAYLERLPIEQYAGIYEELQGSPQAGVRGDELSLILQSWAERDPYAAVAFLEEKPGGTQDWERETTLGAWAAQDPSGALAWAQGAQDEGRINNWVLGAIRGIASSNPELARDHLAQMEAGDTRERSLREIQGFVTQFGFDSAEQWVAGIGDAELKKQAQQVLANDLTRLDPAKAASWAESIQDPDSRSDATRRVGEEYARQDIDAAKDWVASLPLAGQTQAARGVVEQLGRSDPKAGAAWLAGLGTSPEFDGARETLARQTARRDPNVTLEVIGTFANAETRNQAYTRYLFEWGRHDKEAAQAWAAQNQPPGVPQEAIEQLFR